MLKRVLIALLVSVPSAFSQTHQLDTSIRRVNWDSLLAHDKKHFEFDQGATDNFKTQREEMGNYSRPPNLYDMTQVKGLGASALDTVIFLDINRDNVEDAAIEMGGCIGGNGNCGTCVIFLQTNRGPKYLGCTESGWKFHIWKSNDTLVIAKNPSSSLGGYAYDSIVVQKDRIVTVRRLTLPLDSTSYESVERYYEAISKKRFDEAYRMLAPNYQKRHPFKKWASDFKDMTDLKATVERTLNDSVTAIIDYVEDKKGIAYPRRFAVTWHPRFQKGPVYIDYDKKWKQDYEWFLDRPEIREVK